MTTTDFYKSLEDHEKAWEGESTADLIERMIGLVYPSLSCEDSLILSSIKKEINRRLDK